MPKRSYDDFAAAITQPQGAMTPQSLYTLITETVDAGADDVDEEVTAFALSRITLAYRTGNIESHLRHLYDVLAVFERELAKD